MNFSFRLNLSWFGLLIGVNALVFVLFTLSASGEGILRKDAIIVFGELFTPFVVDGMFWLLITSTFLHYDPLHFLLNMVALWQIGKIVEILYSGKKLFTTYILSGVGGSVATLLLSVFNAYPIASVGASGAIFGLLGLFIGGMLRKNRYGIDLPITKESLYPTIVLAIAMSFLPNINWVAHVGGLGVGVVLGLIFENSLTPSQSPRDAFIEKLLISLSLTILVFSYLLLIGNLFFNFFNI